MATTIHNLGFPSIGHRRELKMAVEAYWKGNSSQKELMETAKTLNAKHWDIQKKQGLDLIPVYDFSFYDRMLDTICLLGAAPKRFGFKSQAIDIDGYFGMARGLNGQPALEMTKWFDTNYHYIVPELSPDLSFTPQMDALLYTLEHAKTLLDTKQIKPALIGPLTFLYLGKEKSEDSSFNRLSLLDNVVKAYQVVLEKLKEQGIEWVQIDEPVLTLDLPQEWVSKLNATYSTLSQKAPKILLTTYFESVGTLAEELKRLPVSGLHLDLVRAPQQLDNFLKNYPADKVLSLGLVDGRNIWKTDLAEVLKTLEAVKPQLKERLWIAPSCSLLHVPVDLAQEHKLDVELKSWLAFGVQRLEELAILQKGLEQGQEAISTELKANKEALDLRSKSPKIHNTLVQERISKLEQVSDKRQSEFIARQKKQKAVLNLPSIPTTTIGSFPQTQTIRKARAAFKKGQMAKVEYDEAMRSEIRQAIQKQEALGIDVLVHGEAERNDMVEYFGEQLAGFAFTQAGWVQSYGSRCVKPPVIYGDVYRPTPMTVEWISFAQQQSKKPVKGMLTGPVTILQWSFYRNDQSREQTANQIALAIRDEVQDLEEAGIKVIQIDEPAYREGLPLKRADWQTYLKWASRAFRLSSCSVKDETQIHTHMCYSEFNDIFPGIVDMDADVITIEASRSDLELLKGFKSFNYPNEIGPGVYDVHSPAIPSVENMVKMLKTAANVLSPEQLWVNPDCGLKTRAWEEVEPALKNMVAAAKTMQKEFATV